MARPIQTSTSNPPAGRRIRGLDATERREQRRGQLLDAALELFATNGYLNTSIEQICQTAYVGTKSFYELFDSREACYVALLRRSTERIMATMVDVLAEAPEDEPTGIRTLIGAFAHTLIDDPRIAKVTFGGARAISAEVERQRRVNRRQAASFIESVWTRYDRPAERRHADADADQHRMAIGAVGGLFDLIADWLLDADPGNPDDVEKLITDLTDFLQVIRRGLLENHR